MFKKRNLKIEVEQTQQVLLEYLRCIKVDELHFPGLAVKVVAVVMGLDISVCDVHRVQVLNWSGGIVESYQVLLGKTLEQSTTEQDIDNEGILVTSMPSLSISCSVVDCSKVLPSNTIVNAGNGTS